MRRINYITYLIFVLVFFSKINAQETTFHPVNCISTRADLIRSDALGNIYVVNTEGLFKYDATGVLLYTYSDRAKGSISEVDVSDPMKILVFHKNFGNVVWLDNKLSPTLTPVSLEALGYGNSGPVASSYQGGCWVYDPASLQLIRVDNTRKSVQFSGNLHELTGDDINPQSLTESGNWLYLTDTLQGIYVFDQFATFIKKIPVKQVKYYFVSGEQLIYLSGDKLKSLNLKTYAESSLTLPPQMSTYQTACISLHQLCLYIDGNVCVFRDN